MMPPELVPVAIVTLAGIAAVAYALCKVGKED